MKYNANFHYIFVIHNYLIYLLYDSGTLFVAFLYNHNTSTFLKNTKINVDPLNPYRGNWQPMLSAKFAKYDGWVLMKGHTHTHTQIYINTHSHSLI